MMIEQFVMAYHVDQDRLRAILPEGFVSLRPVLRINAERRKGTGYVEFNTPVQKDGIRGWLNIGFWEDARVSVGEGTTCFDTELLHISFKGGGLEGGCPAEKDNDGCFFASANGWTLRKPEAISANKEYCDCAFRWKSGVGGISTGKTLPAYDTPVQTAYPRAAFTVENAAAIVCDQVLGTYVVRFERETNFDK